MNITVSPELKAYIDPLTSDEHDALERSMLAEGCRDALVLWGDLLVDGHNRYGICQKHDLPFQTVQNTAFKSLDDVYLWMIDQHLGRRSVSDFQRGVLALRKREILTGRREAVAASEAAGLNGEQPEVVGQVEAKPLHSREDIAKAARLSSSQVVQIEKIQKQAAPELVEALKAGSVSLNAAAAVASLPEDEQRAAVIGGKEALKLVAKQVRDTKRRPPEPARNSPEEAAPSSDVVGDELVVLRRRVEILEGENASLREQVAILRQRLGEPAG